ncbi:MAG: hypothetical protein FWH55_04830 [Oscillospiraceae bacterium]|nr:hypothetical protein [Oscillospiraceae bacterium]
MVFKRSVEAWVSVFLICLFVGGILGLITGLNSGKWPLALSGSVLLLGSISMSVFIFKSAKYYLRDDYLHIRGVNYGYWTDEKIAYKDIFFVCTSTYAKVLFFNIIYWRNTQARTIEIPAPSRHVANNQAQKMLECIREKVAETDQSHIISSKFMEKWSNTVTVDWASCLFYDESQCRNDVFIALIHDGNRMILLGNCHRIHRDTVVQIVPLMVVNKEYVQCSIFDIAHVDYATLEEAVNDLRENADGKVVRVIDCIAEDLRTLPRDFRSLRKSQGVNKH